MDGILKLPVVALTRNTVLPKMTVHFDIKKSGSTQALAEALTQDRLVFLTMQESDKPDPLREDLSEIGVIARVKSTSSMVGDVVRIIAEAQQRASLLREHAYGTPPAADERDLQMQLLCRVIAPVGGIGPVIQRGMIPPVVSVSFTSSISP